MSEENTFQCYIISGISRAFNFMKQPAGKF